MGCPPDSRYDVVDVQFHRAAKHIASFRALGDLLVFTSMESQLQSFLIGMRHPFVRLSKLAVREHWDRMCNALEEVVYARKADTVVCVSHTDARWLRRLVWPRNVVVLETGLSTLEFGGALTADFDNRSPARNQRVVLYVAYFNSQTNRDALDWYLRTVHPVVKKSVPSYRLRIVGRGDLTAFQSQADASIEFIGEVPQLGPWIQQSTVGIAPALGGSGFRGKINQYAAFGVPCVASPLSLQGLSYVDKQEVLLARSAEEFADSCISLLVDPARRDQLGRAARARCLLDYTWEAKADEISAIYGVDTAESHQRPRVSVLVPSFQHGRYLAQRIRSIFAQTYTHFEIIVIDDGSTDDSDATIRQLQKTASFTYIQNTRNSGTPFSAWEKIARMARGKYIWVCESDDFAEPEFLETAVRMMERDPAAVLYYSNSWVVDEAGCRIDDTARYFTGTWRESRWDRAFANEGDAELAKFQIRGQTVPNMSSA